MRQFLENERGVEPRERRTTDVFFDVDATEAERRRLAKPSTGKVSFSSQSRACGIMSSRANCRAVAWKARCSSVREKSMGPPALWAYQADAPPGNRVEHPKPFGV